ncbi:cytochrome c oxidase [Actibacterium atlanticum]|uniref:Cbb3-type cytochrome c oxidase subunit n=1 Tax=Actibacterium atlanticum TaxID=1461693 RepID=A0A058ZHZ4_9RHOB|nr:cytochrome-c oxidase, cbb3-type subunit III [Actibacterium atlanticum]KCV81214.1 cytochrome c oxidase [Actibacterium atlanticum]
MSQTDKNKPGEVETTGHSWDGIEEYNNPLPRWWLYSFYACILYAIVYTIAYPAWPLLKEATPGVLGFSTRANVAAEIEKFDSMNAPVESKLVAADLTAIAADPELSNYTNNAGSAVFQTWCAQCHGSGASGFASLGYPNLLDDDWLWGGTIEDIHLTISHGIRNEEDADARYSEMPAFGRDEILSDEEIGQTVQYVMKLSGQDHDMAAATAGETLFLDNCSSCHMEDGTGDIYQGAPNLTDAVWLYGGDAETLTETIAQSRYGVMPSWKGRLSEADIRAVAAYVHQLGGGE